jgi:hypothetical protein
VIDFTPSSKAGARSKQLPDHGPLFTRLSAAPFNCLATLAARIGAGPVLIPRPDVRAFADQPIIDQLVKAIRRAAKRHSRGGVQNLPTLDGLPLYKPPHSRVTAYNLNTGTIARQVRSATVLAIIVEDLNLGPFGNGSRGSPSGLDALVCEPGGRRTRTRRS